MARRSDGPRRTLLRDDAGRDRSRVHRKTPTTKPKFPRPTRKSTTETFDGRGRSKTSLFGELKDVGMALVQYGKSFLRNKWWEAKVFLQRKKIERFMKQNNLPVQELETDVRRLVVLRRLNQRRIERLRSYSAVRVRELRRLQARAKQLEEAKRNYMRLRNGLDLQEWPFSETMKHCRSVPYENTGSTGRGSRRGFAYDEMLHSAILPLDILQMN